VRRLGYRPPPGHRGVRLLIVAGLVVLCALVMKAVADTVLAYAAQAEAIGQIVLPGRNRS
jgi:hypothetical protein